MNCIILVGVRQSVGILTNKHYLSLQNLLKTKVWIVSRINRKLDRNERIILDSKTNSEDESSQFFVLLNEPQF